MCRSFWKERPVCAWYRAINTRVVYDERVISDARRSRCTSKDSKVDVAIKAKAKASRSTYLDIGLGNIGRLEESVRHLTKWAVGICGIPVRSR